MKQISTVLLLLVVSAALSAQSADSAWVFSYFKKNGQDGLHLAYSTDGYQWKSLKNDQSFLKPLLSKDSLMRDPCIIRGADQRFHMVWTVSWHDRGIGYASSPDLVHWSQQQYIPVMQQEDSAKNCWAPEITYDAAIGQYMIYWATTIPGRFPETENYGDNNHRIYYTTTANFKEYSPTKLLYNQGFNVIDATILPVQNRFVMFVKDETLKPVAQKNIRMATSNKLRSGYGKASAPITGNYWAEGPTVVKIKNEWVVYFDKYKDGRYGAIASADLVQWKDISDSIELPAGLRHGTIVAVSKAELELLLQQ